jgi:putative hemolysin
MPDPLSSLSTVVSPGDDVEPLDYGMVIGSITYLSVVFDELVPKHLALKNPEGIACAVVPLMALISRVAAPVAQGHPDNMLGVVQARELLAASLRDEPLDIRRHIRMAPIIPDTLDALEVLQQAKVPMALVHDEYGHFDGVVTPADILDAIAGAFRSDEGEAEPEAVMREDGSWLLAGWMPADEMADQLGISLPDRRDYETVAGLVIGQLQHLPDTGEAVETLGWRFEVVDLDGRRIDKVMASPIENREAA